RVRVSIVASGMADEPRSAAAPGHRQANRPPPIPQQPAPQPEPQRLDPAGARLPSADAEAQGTDNFMDVLTKVIQEDTTTAANSPKSREVWRGPGDVVIEEGLPPLGAG